MGAANSLDSSEHHPGTPDYPSLAPSQHSSAWFYLAAILTFAFFGLQFLKYQANRDQLILKEEKLRQKVLAKEERQREKQA
jgi:hypothetical protein